MAEAVNDLGCGITMQVKTFAGQNYKLYSIHGEAAVARMTTGGIYIYSNRWTSKDIPLLVSSLLLAMDSGLSDMDRKYGQSDENHLIHGAG